MEKQKKTEQRQVIGFNLKCNVLSLFSACVGKKWKTKKDLSRDFDYDTAGLTGNVFTALLLFYTLFLYSPISKTAYIISQEEQG